MYINYNELKEQLVIKDEYSKEFREQTDIEMSKLKEDLLYHKKVLSPLIVKQTFGSKVLIDGHHRWSLLPEVIREYPSFDLNIPIVIIKPEDVSDVMVRTQLGRRNLSAEDIKQYVDVLITEDGLSANKAYKKVAELTGKSKSTIKRICNPKQAEANKLNQRVRDSNKKLSDNRIGIADDMLVKMDNFSPESIETSLKTKPPKVKTIFKQFEEEKPYEPVYKLNEDGTEEYESNVDIPYNEYEALKSIEGAILILSDNLEGLNKSSMHPDIEQVISKYKSRLKKLEKAMG